MLKLAKRFLTEVDKGALWKLAYNMGWKGMRSVQIYKKRLSRGEYYPPFLFIAVTNSCNLRCKGCWVDVAADQQLLDAAKLDKLIGQSKKLGNSYFGILGGEPFMHPELLDILDRHRDCYFQIFTNGQFITEEVAERMRVMGNCSPLVSIEGLEVASDDRRGRLNVLNKTLRGLKNAVKARLVVGVATSLAKNNIDDLLREEWLDKLIDMGVMYVWYYTYRVVGPEPSPELALTPEQVVRTRKFVVEMRTKKPIVMVDAYYDDKGEALCPAATGVSHHINPWGDVEPCPIIQFAKENIDDKDNLWDLFNGSEFLKDFRKTAAQTTRGCIVLERPDVLAGLMEKHGARDTTVRKTAMAELQALESRSSQHQPGMEVPEKSWAYRFAKKHWFFGFGAYS